MEYYPAGYLYQCKKSRLTYAHIDLRAGQFTPEFAVSASGTE